MYQTQEGEQARNQYPRQPEEHCIERKGQRREPGIYVPDPQDEAVRDLIRARYQVQKQQNRARQQLKMFLLRQNIRYAGTKAWTAAHLRFLATVKLAFAEQQ